MLKFLGFILMLFVTGFCSVANINGIITGADQPEKYLYHIENKRVGLVVNHTSLVDDIHLVDFLLNKGIEVDKIFAPEHGFRGDASAGEEIKDGLDEKTGIPVLSLYGQIKKPTAAHLKNLDVLIFDIQDVGCRFYTYISTLHLVIEACAENNISLIVLDRPNPNGDYVAGPVLKPGFESFVGMDPIPVVHGCTVGELAQMINGEKWHKSAQSCDLQVITVQNYTHSTKYELPVNPSPNLPNYLSVRLYPSLCFFEATSVSVGRGTDFPFQVLGGLNRNLGDFQFTPKNIPGVAVNPLNEGKVCYGVDLRLLDEVPKFTLKFFMNFYDKYDVKTDFLTRENWFNLLAGNDELLAQIRKGKSEPEIMEALKPDLEKYKLIRKKYLLYPDFE
ncbi:MAG: DUF1343 domain-containing protein [Bacteroidales bacterium]|nr:DUF1343 domain-containing protein [Bacteroidales bacterium]